MSPFRKLYELADVPDKPLPEVESPMGWFWDERRFAEEAMVRSHGRDRDALKAKHDDERRFWEKAYLATLESGWRNAALCAADTALDNYRDFRAKQRAEMDELRAKQNEEWKEEHGGD